MFAHIVIAIFLFVEGPIVILGDSFPTATTMTGIPNYTTATLNQDNSPSTPTSPMPTPNVNFSGTGTIITQKRKPSLRNLIAHNFLLCTKNRSH